MHVAGYSRQRRFHRDNLRWLLQCVGGLRVARAQADELAGCGKLRAGEIDLQKLRR